MLTVTLNAKQKLEEILQQQETDPGTAIRIVPSQSTSNQLELAFDGEREGDQIVESEEGTKVLLVGSDLAPALEGVVIDYQETPQGESFTLSKPSADDANA
ncbi:MAG: hypothetical protein ACLFVK_02120 [Dehalococcoidia bacterium]